MYCIFSLQPFSEATHLASKAIFSSAYIFSLGDYNRRMLSRKGLLAPADRATREPYFLLLRSARRNLRKMKKEKQRKAWLSARWVLRGHRGVSGIVALARLHGLSGRMISWQANGQLAWWSDETAPFRPCMVETINTKLDLEIAGSNNNADPELTKNKKKEETTIDLINASEQIGFIRSEKSLLAHVAF